MIHVTVYNLSVALQTDEQKLGDLIDIFVNSNYTIKGQSFNGNTGQADKRFVSKLENMLVYYFHINQFRHLLHFLNERNFSMKDAVRENKMDYEAAKEDYTVRAGWDLHDYQKPVVGFVTDDPKGSKMISLQTGQGKCQPLDSKVKVPGGWTTMGEIQLGDTVTAKDGTPTKVVGIYPQGQQEVYNVTFSDGRCTEVGGEHLWKVYYVNTQKHKRWRVVNTLEVMRLIAMPNPRVYVPLINPEMDIDVEVLIDPYLLGCILGNGCISGTASFYSTSDKENVDKVNKILSCINLQLTFIDKYNYSFIRVNRGLPSTFRQNLFTLGLQGKYSHEKFVPKIYLNGSYSQRLGILNGLLDTNGTADRTVCNVSYSSASKQLAEDVQYLVRSLGGIATISIKYDTYYSYNGERRLGRPSYRVNIRHPQPSILFSLTRKKELTNDNNQYAKDLKLRVKSVTLVGVKQTQCIAIEHPDKLYVTDDFIVTHNTFVALYALAQIKMRLAIVILPAYIDF